MSSQLATISSQNGKPRLSAIFADKYAVDPAKIFDLLRATALKAKEPLSNEEVAAFMVVANQYELNPFIKEIYGFVSKGKVQYVISVDGWATLINRQPNLNGIEFSEQFESGKIRSITCRIHRKDRALPTVVTEYYSECHRGDSEPWNKWPVRMLRHKAMIQCARIAFGLAGVMDEDEAERMDGYRAPALIEGGNSNVRGTVASEAVELMDKLNWSLPKRQLAVSNYPGDKLLPYLRECCAKAGLIPSSESEANVQPERVVEYEAEAQDQGDEAEPEPQVAATQQAQPATTANLYTEF